MPSRGGKPLGFPDGLGSADAVTVRAVARAAGSRCLLPAVVVMVTSTWQDNEAEEGGSTPFPRRGGEDDGKESCV
jgi:hypothetical protein